MGKKIIIGITGAIGSGKTTAASFFPKQKWKIINVDQLGHSLLKKHAIKKRLFHRFGAHIQDQTTGEISRKKLAAIVFNNTKKLQALNKIMHPLLKKEVAKKMQTQKHLVLDCALLIPLGLAKKCTTVIEIQAPQKIISQRLKNKYTKKQQRFVMQQQQTIPAPDFILMNDRTKKDLQTQIKKIITFLYAA
ncbi:dephospho-CoA kinase [Candidatus Woesearchaeota archaeon]|nr:dephospho-CoA kinase [Candidatus Woesearchaeota archaeon]